MKPYPFYNTSGGTIPAGAAMVVTGVTADGFLTVAQSAADSVMNVVFNGPIDVPDLGYGVAFAWGDGDVPAGVWAADEPYTAADTFGTKNGDWLLRKGKTGFRVVGPAVQGLAPAMPDPLGAFGPARNIPTNVCPVRDPYGVITGLKVEFTPVTFPVGTTFGTPFCVTNPNNCCGLICPGCPTPVAVPFGAHLNFTSKTGEAVSAPNSVPLVPISASEWRPFPTFDYATYGYTYDPTNTGGGFVHQDVAVMAAWQYRIVALGIGCGSVSGKLKLSYQLTSGAFGSLPIGPLVGSLGSADVDCNVFGSSGSVVLGTITNPGGLTSSVTVSISW